MAVANYEIYRTEDFGKHWVRALTTINEGDVNFDSISFVSEDEGCAVGNSSFIYCTGDGGKTWEKSRVFKDFPQDSPFRSKIFLFGSGKGWASADGSLYRTEDRGGSFSEVLASTAAEER